MKKDNLRLKISALYLATALSGSVASYSGTSFISIDMSIINNHNLSVLELEKVKENLYDVVSKSSIKNPKTLNKVNDLILRRESLEYKINQLRDSQEYQKANDSMIINFGIYLLSICCLVSSGISLLDYNYKRKLYKKKKESAKLNS